MGHKNRGEDPHHGASRNSRKGTHRRRGSGGGDRYFKAGNCAVPGCCSFCYPELCRRLLEKWCIAQELRRIRLT